MDLRNDEIALAGAGRIRVTGSDGPAERISRDVLGSHGSLLRCRDCACIAHLSDYALIWANKTLIASLGKVKKSCQYEIQALK